MCQPAPRGSKVPLLPPLATLERVASAVFFTENRIECNVPTSTTGKQGPLASPVGHAGEGRECGFLYGKPHRVQCANQHHGEARSPCFPRWPRWRGSRVRFSLRKTA